MSGFAHAWSKQRGTLRRAGGMVLAAAAIVAAAVAIALLPLTWMVLLVVGAVVVTVTLVEPRLGLLLLVPAVPFGSVRQVTVGGMNVGAAEALLALVVAAWLVRRVVRRETGWRWPPLSLPLALFATALLLSTLGATSLRAAATEVVKWIEVLALYMIVANEFDVHWTRWLVAVVLGTGALAALQGIYQFLFQVGPEPFILFGRFMRAYGSFAQPNPYAGYLGLTLPVALGLLVAWILSLRKSTPIVSACWLLWSGGCGVLMLAALVMSWSRGAWLGFAAAAAAMAVAAVARSGRAAVLVIILVAVVLYGVLAGGLAHLPPALVQRFDDFLPYLGLTDVRGREITDANFAVLERMAHWQAAIGMWTDHPWLGVGAGNYEVVYDRYALPLWPLPLGHAHNYYLNVGAEAGIVGLGAYLFLYGAVLLSAWRAARRLIGWEWGVALGVLGVGVHLGVHHLFDNLFVHGIYLHLAILLGILSAFTWRSDPEVRGV
ncbi:MAG: O-antigen ligase family protein [Anaerolineae bacterium]|nr:O-antigen ligase family protein [Anaerolineae bacterium]